MRNHTNSYMPKQEAQHLSPIQKAAIFFVSIVALGGYLAMIKIEQDGKEQI